LQIYSKNLETSDFQYVGTRDVEENFWADLDNVDFFNFEIGLFTLPLELIYHDYVLYFTKGIKFIR
jgi:hypothetical protein